MVPRPLRALLMYARHREYDLASCHLAALASVLASHEAPILHHLLQQLMSANRTTLLQHQLGGKQSLLVPLNCGDLLVPSGAVQRWMRAQKQVPHVTGLLGCAEQFNGDYLYRRRTRYEHTAGAILSFQDGHWEFAYDSHGPCFRITGCEGSPPPEGLWDAVRTQMGQLRLSWRPRSFPTWYAEYIEELHHAIPVAILRLEQRGFTGLAGQTERNLVYHHTAHAEARVVRLVLQELRLQRPLFSHALVHDALILDRCIPAAEVLATFDRVAALLGLPLLHATEKSWVDDVVQARANLQSAQYSSAAVMPLDSEDTYDEARTLYRYAARGLFDIQHRAPRR